MGFYSKQDTELARFNWLTLDGFRSFFFAVNDIVKRCIQNNIDQVNHNENMGTLRKKTIGGISSC